MICTCRFTFFLMSVLYLVCADWYSFITSTNLRVSVFERFSRIRISDCLLLPGVPFSPSVSSLSFFNSCFAIAAFLFVSVTNSCSSWLSSCSLSLVVASTTCWLISATRFVEFRMTKMCFLTNSTSLKNCCMDTDPVPDDDSPVIPMTRVGHESWNEALEETHPHLQCR